MGSHVALTFDKTVWRKLDRGTIRETDVHLTLRYTQGTGIIRVWFQGSHVIEQFKVPGWGESSHVVLKEGEFLAAIVEYLLLIQDSELRAALYAMSIPRRR